MSLNEYQSAIDRIGDDGPPCFACAVELYAIEGEMRRTRWRPAELPRARELWTRAPARAVTLADSLGIDRPAEYKLRELP